MVVCVFIVIVYYQYYFHHLEAFATRQCWQRHYVFRQSVWRVRPFVCLFKQILLARYFMNGLCNLDEIYTEYLLPYTDILMTLLGSGGQRSRSRQVVELAKASTSTPVDVHLLIL